MTSKAIENVLVFERVLENKREKITDAKFREVELEVEFESSKMKDGLTQRDIDVEDAEEDCTEEWVHNTAQATRKCEAVYESNCDTPLVTTASDIVES